jgi:hypothetical protein
MLLEKVYVTPYLKDRFILFGKPSDLALTHLENRHDIIESRDMKI